MRNTVKRNPAFLFVTLLALFCASSAWAHYDYKAYGGLRMGPMGIGLGAEGGYNQMLWGERGGAGFDKVKYGYVRPALNLSTSALINTVETRVDFYPISFLKISGGASVARRDVDVDSVNCTKVECRGNLKRGLIETELKLGVSDYFTIVSYNLSFNKPDTITKDFGDENTNLVGQQGGDTLVNLDILLGYVISKEWAAGLFRSTQEYRKSKTMSDLFGAFLNYEHEQVGIGGYVGNYRTSFYYAPISVGAKYTWTFSPDFGL